MEPADQTRDFDVTPSDANASPPSGVGPGTCIGRYKVLEEIGEGGFGTVFLAQQLEPVKRRVALKLIKLGMDTRQVIARFEAERQALALMDHPHIARVLDGGATENGRPYFVMELVRGEPITDFADRKRLSTRKRLELFLQVCQATQHAHQKGIIHRDIKPTNVLVTITDNNHPHAKVIDFGIAKATNSELTEKTLHTEFHQLVGTPVYMSPEQAERAGVDVDTRTDIYSLGVMLYELLTGTTPFDLQRMKTASWNELQRIICDEDPPTMSARISALGNQSTQLAKNRDCEPARLKGLLRRDLDWIVLKAMEKDRTRRYGTVAEFADDIQRYLRDDAVSATPPTPSYRLRKFIRKNRVTLSIASVFVLSLVLGLIVTTNLMFWALAERERAQENNRRAELYSSLAGTTFLNAEELRGSAKKWGDEIKELRADASEDTASLIQKECQYATWLLTQATNHHLPDLLNESVVDLDDLQSRAKASLGLGDTQFLSLVNARIQAAIVLEKKNPTEMVSLFSDIVSSYQQVGENDEGYTRMVIERSIAALVANAGSRLPPAEALAVMAETIQKVGVTLDSKSPGLNVDPQVKALVDRVSGWAENPQELPRPMKKLFSWLNDKSSVKPIQEKPEVSNAPNPP